mgnify:CR=1 FL=1|jgi:5S rRNA maturation endonuclease (ribonuclease M5)
MQDQEKKALKQTKSKTLSQPEIAKVCDMLSERVDELLDRFGVDYVEYPNRFSFPCPVHGGDSPEGCTVFTDGDTVKGNWKCWTCHCEEEWKDNIFGFVRGSLSYQKGRSVSLNEAFSFCLEFLGESKIDIDENRHVTNNKKSKLLDLFQKKYTSPEQKFSRDSIQKKLDIPSSYYIDRGYKKETLITFDVGDCSEVGKPMYKRAVVPIYDINYSYLGCVGRDTTDKSKQKWLHSKGFKKNSLYGINIAKDFMKDRFKYPTLFILEGQGDVWRMHESGYKNSVSIFGSALSDDQLVLLEEVGVMNLIILTDYDEAGKKAAKQIVQKGGRRFNYYRPTISTKDVGDMSIEELNLELNPQLSDMETIRI